MSNATTAVEMTTENVDYLLSPQAIRDSARQIYDLTVNGGGHFEIHADRKIRDGRHSSKVS